jgi:hypothetical protein
MRVSSQPSRLGCDSLYFQGDKTLHFLVTGNPLAPHIHWGRNAGNRMVTIYLGSGMTAAGTRENLNWRY